MAKPWMDSVKNTGKLSIFNGIEVGKWAGLFQTGLDEFNKLLKGSGLSLKMEKAADEKTSNVVVRATDGPISFEYEGTSYSKPFDGKRLHGHTSLIWRADDPKIEKAFVFIPNDPQISGAGKTRGAGLPVLQCILVHELIHACGLENPGHSNDDIFHGFPQADSGTTPNDDRLRVSKDGKDVKLPPIFLSSTTVSRLKILW